MRKIRPDRKLYAPVINGERQFYLSSNKYLQAITNIEKTEGAEWEELKKQGWTIESFWRSEYE